jgi:hypothetical protein
MTHPKIKIPPTSVVSHSHQPKTNNKKKVESKCLLKTHETTKVADLIQMSARL